MQFCFLIYDAKKLVFRLPDIVYRAQSYYISALTSLADLSYFALKQREKWT